MVLTLQGINKSFPGAHHAVTALSAIELTVAAGELAVISGVSGSGKTTLLLVAGGMLRPDSGSARIADVDLYALSSAARAAQRAANVGFVFQQFHLLPYLNVLDNMVVPGLTGDATGLITRARELAARFGLGARLDHLPAALSTGERQRVALARALLRRPALLLADEPTGNLDQANAAAVWDQLEEVARAGAAVLVASHDIRATGRATRRWAMDQGRLVAAAKPS